MSKSSSPLQKSREGEDESFCPKSRRETVGNTSIFKVSQRRIRAKRPFVARVRVLQRAAGEHVLDSSVSDVVAYRRIAGGLSEALAQVVRRRLLPGAAEDAGIRHALHKADGTRTWMANNGITVEMLAKHLEENIRISKARDHIAETSGDAYAQSSPVTALVRELSVEDWIARQLAN